MSSLLLPFVRELVPAAKNEESSSSVELAKGYELSNMRYEQTVFKIRDNQTEAQDVVNNPPPPPHDGFLGGGAYSSLYCTT